MNLFRRKEKRERQTEFGAEILSTILSDYKITREQAMQIPTFSACVDYISSIIAMLPIKLYEENADEITEIKDDNRVFLLNDECGDLLNCFEMKKAFVADYLVDGNGYIYINKEKNKVKSLHYVDCRNVATQQNFDPIFKDGEILVNGAKYREFEFLKLLNNSKNGISGTGIVKSNSLILLVVYLSLGFEKRLVEKGGAKKGFLQAENKVEKDVIEQIRERWKNLYNNNDDNMMILNKGLTFTETSSSSVELQLNEQKVTNAELICNIFKMSTRIINGTATNEEFSTVAKTVILPIVYLIQTILNRDLLLESEKKTKYFVFDTAELLKGDILKRYQAYEIALKNNILQIDEVRYLEDKKPIGFKYLKLGLNDVLFDVEKNEVFTPNTKEITKLNTD